MLLPSRITPSLGCLLAVFTLAVCDTSRAEPPDPAPSPSPAAAQQSPAQALEEGGLEKLAALLAKGGSWPRITTDSLAKREGNEQHAEQVKLTKRVIGLLREGAKEKLAEDPEKLAAEAERLDSLATAFWRAGGYRNHVTALLCMEMATLRCGKIALLTKGQKKGPPLPAALQAKDLNEVMEFIKREIPESQVLVESGLLEAIKEKPPGGEATFQALYKMSELELNGQKLGKKYPEAFAILSGQSLASLAPREAVLPMVFNWSIAIPRRESFVASLATYLEKGGSLQTLREEGANETKFREVMGQDELRFTLKPAMRDYVSVSHLSSFLETLEQDKRIEQGWFGDDDEE